ncbi:MAG: glycosyltransferase family 4 protein [Theionarchaea archaeon]|nr:glycosyltransferase family 4 protein [Theionarchaea archaeon]MBU7001222.1 glycosyltransferase family 4 protein [Theionarchaea archaeon]MBU7022096.1 glycosyltransferase family 4 protein [Theionarchaea archaeon]MBU7035659.1 glycosyltransferase family 4 protein [Theionarchaea archaeon]
MNKKVGIIADRLNRTLTGVGTYVYHLVRELSKTEDISLITYEDPSLPFDVPTVIMNPLGLFSSKSLYLWHFYVNGALRRTTEFDILHSPENAALVVPVKCRKVVTIHDLILYLFPQYTGLLHSIRYRMLPWTIKTADRIIAVSQSTKQDLVTRVGVPQHKITVIYPGVGPEFRPCDPDIVKKTRDKYHLNTPVILYTGTLAPHKNVSTLVTSFKRLKESGMPHSLVLTGVKGWRYKPVLETIQRLHLEKDVLFTGYIPYEDMPGMYSAADLYVYPSLYEGFGLPVVEAMACGCPVVASNVSSLPEVVGDAGVLAAPTVDELATSMQEILRDESLRNELSRKGLDRASKFTWKKTAVETRKVYEELV